MTLTNLCINRCNSSKVAWCLSGKRRNDKDLITSFFNVCFRILCTFNGKRSNFFQEFFILRGSNDVTVPWMLLGHCSNKYTIKTGSSISKLSLLSDSEITSGRINIESNKQYIRKVEWCNIWINGSLGCRMVLKLWNIGIKDLTNMTYSLRTGCLNAFTNLFFLLGFLSRLFSVMPLSKSKLDRQYDWKESYCINILSKHFRKFNHLVETWFITFLTSLLLRLMNFLSCFFVSHSQENDSICQ